VEKNIVKQNKKSVYSLTPSDFLEHLKKIIASEFAIKQYQDRDIKESILFEILLNEKEKLITRLSETSLKRLIAGEEIVLAELGLFSFDMVIGNISIRDIVHDAVPSVPELSSFFEKKKGSKYQNKPELYPLGIAGGKVEIIFKSKNILKLKLIDVSGKMSGIYYFHAKNKGLSVIRKSKN